MPQHPASSTVTCAPGMRSSSFTVGDIALAAFWWQWP